MAFILAEINRNIFVGRAVGAAPGPVRTGLKLPVCSRLAPAYRPVPVPPREAVASHILTLSEISKSELMICDASDESEGLLRVQSDKVTAVISGFLGLAALPSTLCQNYHHKKGLVVVIPSPLM